MSELRPPYKTLLGPTNDAETRARMWRRIEARRGAKPVTASTWRWAAAGAASAVVAVALWRAGAVVPAPVTPLPAPVVATAAAPAAPDVTVTQEVGTQRYHVTAGPRHVVDAGLATLTFDDADVSVERAEHHLRLQVQRGDVNVQSAHIKGGTAHLSAGMLLDIDDEPAVAPRIALPSSVAAPQVAPWKALAAQGHNPEAYAALGPGGVAAAARSASIDELLALADVARLSNHAREAVDPLERVVRDHPTDGRASLAAFTLARVYLDTLANPTSAARALEQALALGLPGGLEEDAYARLVEAKSRAGDAAGARAAYDRARARFPDGGSDTDMRRWIDPK